MPGRPVLVYCILALSAASAQAEKAAFSYVDPAPCCLADDLHGDVFVVSIRLRNSLPDATSVAKVNAGGSVLSTYRFRVGEFDEAKAAGVDRLGNLWVVGSTGYPAYRGLIVELDSAGTSILYSGTFGGQDPKGVTAVNAIAFDNNGNVYIGGLTSQSDFPVTPGGFKGKFGSPRETSGWRFFAPSQYGFVSKLAVNRDGGYALVFSALLGGEQLPTTPCPSGGECFVSPPASSVSALAVGSDGMVTVAGVTNAADYPTTGGAFQTSCPCEQSVGIGVGFVARLNAEGNRLIWSTFLGAGSVTSGVPTSIGGIALDPAGNVIVTGATPSAEFPVTSGALQRFIVHEGAGNNGFVTKLASSGSRLLFSTLYGGAVVDRISAPRLDAQGNIWLSEQIRYRSGVPLPRNSLLLGHPSASPLITELTPDGSTVLFSESLPNGAAGQDLLLGADDSLVALGSGDGANGRLLRQSRLGISDLSILGVADIAANRVTSTVAPGEIISIYGTQLGPGGTEVSFNGKPAQVLYSSENQLNLLVPYDVQPGDPLRMQVITPSGPSQLVPLEIVAAQPNVVALLNPNGGSVTSGNPAIPGTAVTVLLNGAGARNPDVQIAVTYYQWVPRGVSPSTVNVTPSFAGPNPDQPNLLRIDVPVPNIPGMLYGFEITVSVGTARSPAVFCPI